MNGSAEVFYSDLLSSMLLEIGDSGRLLGRASRALHIEKDRIE